MLGNLNTKTKLTFGFSLVIVLTLAIVLFSFYSLNETEHIGRDYETVTNAQKFFLKANSNMESYLNDKDSLEYENCSFYLDTSIHTLDIVKPRLNGENLPLFNELYVKLRKYKKLMLQSHKAITRQKEIYGNRRAMRKVFTKEIEENRISRDHDINYYFNQARLNAVYLLSSNDSVYFNETQSNIQLALKAAKKINNTELIKALDDYMVSVKDNYDLSLIINENKNAQLLLGKEILDTSEKMIDNFKVYKQSVIRSTKIFMFIFSVISIILSIIISRLIIIYITGKQRIIEDKNKLLLEQADSMAAINALLEERQIKVEEQSEELMAQRDQLTTLNATKDKLFSILAHDLRSPFNSILGFSDLLLMNIRQYTIEKIETQVRYIRDATNYTFNLLDNLLQWSRAQRGIIGFDPELIKISEHVNHELKNLRHQALNKEISIEVIVHGEEKLIEADPNLINTIIRNLICNAVKFSNKKTQVLVTLHFNEEEFVFSVKDYGIGISDKIKDELFKIGGHISCAGTAGEKGTGLGLLLCADFIMKHNGNIWVQSEKGKGSTFYFSIPYQQNNSLEN